MSAFSLHEDLCHTNGGEISIASAPENWSGKKVLPDQHPRRADAKSAPQSVPDSRKFADALTGAGGKEERRTIKRFLSMSNEAKNCWPPLTPHHWLAGYLSTMFQPFTRFSNTSFTIILITILRRSFVLLRIIRSTTRSYTSPGKVKYYFSFYFCECARFIFVTLSLYRWVRIVTIYWLTSKIVNVAWIFIPTGWRFESI